MVETQNRDMGVNREWSSLSSQSAWALKAPIQAFSCSLCPGICVIEETIWSYRNRESLMWLTISSCCDWSLPRFPCYSDPPTSLQTATPWLAHVTPMQLAHAEHWHSICNPSWALASLRLKVWGWAQLFLHWVTPQNFLKSAYKGPRQDCGWLCAICPCRSLFPSNELKLSR